jgi:hypothetical protein
MMIWTFVAAALDQLLRNKFVAILLAVSALILSFGVSGAALLAARGWDGHIPATQCPVRGGSGGSVPPIGPRTAPEPGAAICDA